MGQHSSTYEVVGTIAITDGSDISTCKVIRKLEVGEELLGLGVPQDDDKGTQRVNVKATKDDQEGWVTTKGNAGTHYLKVAKQLWTVERCLPLQNNFSSASASTICELNVGETLEVLDGPKEETIESSDRVKGRCLSDGK